MKNWTRGSSPRSGSWNAWTWIKNVNGASRLNNFWNFFRRDPNDFMSRLVKMDETWLYHYDPETKQQSMEWRYNGSPRPKNSECKNPLENSRLDFLGLRRNLHHWLSSKSPNYQRGVLLICWCNWRTFWRKKAAGSSPRWSCSCTTNPAHWAIASQKKLAYLGFQFIDHPPYSPDLAPSNYHLIPGLKKQLKGRHFSSDVEVILLWKLGWTDNFLNFLSGL